MACPHCKVDDLIGGSDSCRTWGRLGASARGLFGGYRFQHQVSSKTIVRNGNVTFESGAGSLPTGATSGFLQGEYRFPSTASAASLKFDTVNGLECRSRWDKVLNTAGLSWNNKLTVGSEGSCGDVSVQDFEFQNKQLAIGLGVQSPNPLTSAGAGHTVVEATGSVIVGETGLVLAGQSKFNAVAQSLVDFNIGTEFTTGPVTATVKTTRSMTGLTTSYFHKLWSEVDVAAEADLKREGLESASFGTEYRLDRETTLKAKMSTLGTVSTSVEHRLADPRLKLGLCTSFDATGREQLVANKFGFSLTYGDFSPSFF